MFRPGTTVHGRLANISKAEKILRHHLFSDDCAILYYDPVETKKRTWPPRQGAQR